MCGRVAVTNLTEILAEFGISKPVPAGWEPAYNIGPSAQVPVVRSRPDSRRLNYLRWGLLPVWVKDPKIGSRMFNAKVETIAEQRAFSEPFRQRRCLVAVSGFFDWKQEGEAKLPSYVTRFDGRPLAVAGVWDLWVSAEGEVVETCAIVTKPAVAPLVDLSGRMPAILAHDAVVRWLDARTTNPELLRAIVLEPSPELRAIPVGSHVNSVANQGAECIMHRGGSAVL